MDVAWVEYDIKIHNPVTVNRLRNVTDLGIGCHHESGYVSLLQGARRPRR
jgi:hypothetical protein